jgi:hypothetical protein
VDQSPTQAILDERRAFRRMPDGTIGVRRLFGSDLAALLVAVLLPFAVITLVTSTFVLMDGVLPERDADRTTVDGDR